MPDQHAADDIRAERRPVRGALPHQLTGPPRIAAAALDDLDEAGLVWVADDVDEDLRAVAKADLPSEELGGLGPPPVLLGSVAVAPGGLLRLEAGKSDEPIVVGHSGR